MLFAGASIAESALIDFDGSSKPTVFAADELESALRTRGYDVRRHDSRSPDVFVAHLNLFVSVDLSAALAPEGFSLRRTGSRKQRVIAITAKDSAGAMYGLLELAEQIRTRDVDGVMDTDREPYMPMRGTKFNIPLDLRNPSYSDMSDSAQQNIGTVWDFEFWRQYLDALARGRYNYVSIWNLHPFPSMVKVPEFPEVALDDVWRSKVRFEEDYPTRTTDLVTPAMLANKEVVKRLTIDQKIDFWRRVMAHAKDRNIDFYVITWNIFTYGVDGKYGITDAIDNPKTVDYFRASVREMFRTYPLLRGIGLTAGENMGDASAYYSGGTDSFDAKENWLLATYGQGVLDAARAEPQRQFRLIHRQHESRAQDIAATFKPVIAQPNVDFVFSFKYAQAHALSSTTQTFHRGYLESLGELRDSLDAAQRRRAFVPLGGARFRARVRQEHSLEGNRRATTSAPTCGCGVANSWRAIRNSRASSKSTNTGCTFCSGAGSVTTRHSMTNASRPSSASDSPGIDAARFLNAWQDASMIYPLVTGFHWANFDFQWYIEGCRSRPGPAKTASGFHSVETFINQPVHPGTNNVTIPAYVAGVSAGKVPPGTTPFEVADEIDRRADAALGVERAIREASPGGDKPGVRGDGERYRDHGHARQVLRGQDPWCYRARAVSKCRDRGAPGESHRAPHGRRPSLVAVHGTRSAANYRNPFGRIA